MYIFVLPNSVNVPTHTEGNELVLAGNAGVNGVDVQSSYTLSKHLGLMLNASFDGVPNAEIQSFGHGHYFSEVGLGYYSVVNDMHVLSLYGGLGYGYYETKN